MSRNTLAAIVIVSALCTLPLMIRGGEEAVKPEGTKGRDMVVVAAGEFMMGCNSKRDGHCDRDERPYHAVYLDAFYIDRHEVKNADYLECVKNDACRPARTYPDFDGPEQPVVGVSWDDAANYCRWAGKSLPTEAQWEKAARGTDGRVYPWGSSWCGCDCAIQEYRQSYGCGKDATWTVGSAARGASPYGALDMAGNVWEWVSDWYGAGYYSDSPKENPPGPASGEKRVKRGGGYANTRTYLRASDRSPSPPSVASDSTGFRCALAVPEELGPY